MKLAEPCRNMSFGGDVYKSSGGPFSEEISMEISTEISDEISTSVGPKAPPVCMKCALTLSTILTSTSSEVFETSRGPSSQKRFCKLDSIHFQDKRNRLHFWAHSMHTGHPSGTRLYRNFTGNSYRKFCGNYLGKWPSRAFVDVALRLMSHLAFTYVQIRRNDCCVVVICILNRLFAYL